jgi:hypothetical protein
MRLYVFFMGEKTALISVPHPPQTALKTQTQPIFFKLPSIKFCHCKISHFLEHILVLSKCIQDISFYLLSLMIVLIFFIELLPNMDSGDPVPHLIQLLVRFFFFFFCMNKFFFFLNLNILCFIFV